MEKDDCPTCQETLDAPVVCRYCKKAACLACTKAYILTKSIEFSCMYCKIIWPLVDQKKLLPSAWVSSTKRKWAQEAARYPYPSWWSQDEEDETREEASCSSRWSQGEEDTASELPRWSQNEEEAWRAL